MCKIRPAPQPQTPKPRLERTGVEGTSRAEGLLLEVVLTLQMFEVLCTVVDHPSRVQGLGWRLKQTP